MGASFKLNKRVFSSQIEEKVLFKNYTYIDAVLELCQEHNIEPDTVKKLISAPIRERLETEGQEINILPKPSRLPV